MSSTDPPDTTVEDKPSKKEVAGSPTSAKEKESKVDMIPSNKTVDTNLDDGEGTQKVDISSTESRDDTDVKIEDHVSPSDEIKSVGDVSESINNDSLATVDPLTTVVEDEESRKEFLAVFIQEFEELMEIYNNGLKELCRINGDRAKAFQDLFRVYHTLKGDSAYFPNFSEFTKFCFSTCEDLRNLPEDRFHDEELLTKLRINFTRLSSALSAVNRGQSMHTFRFQIFLQNF